jgi:hypothetical protein
VWGRATPTPHATQHKKSGAGTLKNNNNIMTTQQFIAREVARIEAGNVTGEKRCASVVRYGDRIYSYGTHYPLLFRVQDAHGGTLWVCNNGGYSSTTGKHIAWAGGYADILAPLGGIGYGARAVDREDVIKAIQARIDRLQADMDSKKRKDTQVYRNLEQQHAGYMGYLARLTN